MDQNSDIRAYRHIAADFRQELETAKAGKPTSLAYIRHHLPDQPLVHPGESFLALVIGGSLFRAAVVVNRNGFPHIESEEKGSIPTLLNTEILMQFIAARIPAGVSTVAINFAFAMKPEFIHGKLEGILLSGGKEHGLTDLLGKPVAGTLEAYMRQKYGRTIRVSVANDAICLLLSGLSQFSRNELVAGIVGTGLNIAVFEDEHTAVNTESGLFSNFSMSHAAKIVDKLSKVPGKAVYEKEVSGLYLSQLYAVYAGEQGVSVPDAISGADVSAIAYDDNHPGSTIAKAVLERSAALVACQLVGIANWYARNITVVMEGGVYWNAWRYQHLVSKWIRLLQSPEARASTSNNQPQTGSYQLTGNYAISIVRVPDCDLAGAIHLVL